MIDRTRFPSLFGTLLAAMVLLLGGCDKNASQESERAAARDNVDAMSREHAGDSTLASGAADVTPARAVISQQFAYTELNNELVYGYFSAPADMFEPLPAVIMIHEWWGLNNNIRAMADRLAAEGFIVLAVDLYGGQVAENAAQARELMLQVVEDPEPAVENLRAAIDFVTNTAGAPRVASLGWCFGGGWSLNAAQLFADDIDASVMFYGQVTDDEEKLSAISSPILGLFAADDTGIKLESVESFAAALQRLEKNHDVHIYPGVGHAFANPTGNNYDADAAEDAWSRTLEFLTLHLASSED